MFFETAPLTQIVYDVKNRQKGKVTMYGENRMEDTFGMYGFKNVRFSHLDKIREIRLKVAGQWYDRIPKELIKPLQYIYNATDPQYVPFFVSFSGMLFLEFHVVQIVVEYAEPMNDAATLFYDFYDTLQDQKTAEHVMYHLQRFAWKWPIRVNFQFPCLYFLLVDCVETVITLCFDYEELKIPITKQVDNVGIYALVDDFTGFHDALNLSLIEDIEVVNTCTEVFVLSANGIRVSSGLAGLVFGM